MDPARTAADVLNGQPVMMSAIPTHEMIQKAAQKFDQRNPIETYNAIDWIKKRGWFGGHKHAEKVLRNRAQDIEDAAEAYRIDPAFLRSIVRMENTFNPDPFFMRNALVRGIARRIFERPKSVSPGNVNYDVWGDLLIAHGITESMMSQPRTNIFAMAIVLKELDNALVVREGETVESRVAQVASLYGHTEKTIASEEGVIMYGGKAAAFYVQEVGEKAARERLFAPTTESSIAVDSSLPTKPRSQSRAQG